MRGNTLENVRKKLLFIFKDKRVIVHGDCDMSALNLTTEELIQNGVEIVDTAKLYRDSNMQPIGLENHDKFWYEGKKLQRGSWHHPINGHSPERDCRLTLLIYKKYIQFQESQQDQPSGNDIRKARNSTYNFNKWKQERASSRTSQ